MTTAQADLNLLFDQVDDWFSDLPLEKPISQIAFNEDQSRLASINRTTNNWFKFLSKPPLTDEGIEDTDFAETDKEDEPIKVHEHPSLESLARDLELLLENDSENIPEYHFFKIHLDDYKALLDPRIGSSCTIRSSARQRECSIKSGASSKEIQIVMNRDDYHQRELEKSQILTPMPLDHDYLPKPRRKSIQPLSSNRPFTESKKRENILNIDALKRFARFSDKFRVLSMIDC